MLREVDKKDAVLAALDGRLVYRITKNTDGSVHAADLTECLGNLLYFDKVKFVADIPEPEPQEEKPIQQEEPKADTPEPAGEVPPRQPKRRRG
ncbi:MAG: hypothetical protein LUC83_10000 [Clostridiales bacterium]|nr:hypothetical protein [Clostridiales bacterium]